MTWSLGEAFSGSCSINNTVVMWKIPMYWTSLACQMEWVLYVTSNFTLFPLNCLRYHSFLICIGYWGSKKKKREVPQKFKCVLIKSSPHERQGQSLWLKYSLCGRQEVFWVLCSGLIKRTGLCAFPPTPFYKTAYPCCLKYN